MNNITAKDLMVGDWVMLTDPINNGEKVQVKVIHGDGYITVDGGLTALFNPIPLTAEILEKNGFEREEIIQSHWISEDGRILLRNDESLINSNNKWSVHVDNEDMQTIGYFEITYAHELQHALRLAGIDKELTI